MQAGQDNLITFDTVKLEFMLRTLSLFTLLLIGTGLYSQSRMSSSEISHLYNTEHEFILDERVAKAGNRYKVYLRFRLNSGMVKISDYELSYDLRGSYIDEKLINASVKLDSSHVIDNGFREFTYVIDFIANDDQDLLVIQIDNLMRNRKYHKDIALSSENATGYQSFLLFQEEKDLPYFENYVNVGTKLRVQNVLGEAASFAINGSTNQKRVAMPPFDDNNRKDVESSPLETSYGVRPGEVFEFEEAGFYEIIAGTDESQKSGILVTDAFYPYFEEYTHLIQPLIYICTNQEFAGMLASEDTKSSFENFVLETISSNTNIAQEFVKYYYRRVRKSAQLFTTTTEGWKTDRGMVYQVYGNPANVFRNETTELWVYTLEGGSRARFIFDIEKSPSGIREYKLIRGKKYREGWMNAVTRWRSGRIIE